MYRSSAALAAITLVAALAAIAVAAAPAAAAPTQVHVRIEGKTKTIFEGPVLTDVHRVKSANDSKWRRCNGVTGLSPSQAPAAVPTSAAADAMRIIGESFDGLWYTQWEDYFVERWGPDSQAVGSFDYWGILVNNVFTDVGGCQYRLDGDDEVLWVFDAFDDRPRLVLYPGGYSGGALPATATATLDQPFELEVDTWASYNEGTPPPAPTRSTTPYAGAEVAPVQTSAEGFQTVDVANPQTVLSGADGRATVVFTEPGWHRIKATDFAGAAESAIRSNRLDVCVPQPPASGCGPAPADAQVRTPPPPLPEEVEGNASEEPKGQPSGGGQSGAGTPGPTAPGPADPGQVRLGAPRLDRSRAALGLVKVSWRVLDPGVGIGKWTIASQRLGRKGARWIVRARGSEKAAATVLLPAGTHRLRLSVVDALGRASSASLGKVQVAG